MDIKLLIAGGVALFSAGVGVGYLGTRKYLEDSYAQMADDEIAEARKFYNHLKKEGYPSPEDAVKGLHPDGVDPILDEAAEALISYQGGDGDPIPPDFEEKQTNIFDDAVQINGLDIESRSSKRPYVITADEFVANEKDYVVRTVTYFAGDNKVVDEEDNLVELFPKLLGNENLSKFGIGSDDENVVLIQNDQYKALFEVTYSKGHYAHEVLGLEEEIRHADQPRRRGRPRWDDE